MQYPRGFFTLQLTFAQKMAELSQQAYEDAMRRNTALYRIFGLDWSLNPEHPVWQKYLRGLHGDERDVDWTYQYYLEHYDTLPPYNRPRWGCFSYEYLADSKVIHIHFADLDRSGYGPLSHQRKRARIAELQSMFTHIQDVQPEATSVHGSSWLYNREAYRRLFPLEYVQSARASKASLIGRGLWGQFLRHNGEISDELATLFLQRVSQLSEEERYPQCFPYQLLLTEAPIKVFYEFYRIQAG